MAGTTLADIRQLAAATRQAMGSPSSSARPTMKASSIDWLQEARVRAAGVILNAAGFSHTSVALLDALPRA